ncbi:NAD(P)/FAD-dependent oxidoreductase [Anaerococcus sp. mt242]|uniref:NAD(P)/FAD-dependent oxidoreductase n=1 Tax=Anaerococcus sp. mt242 TaxID=2661917 RepID=UPI00193350D1|nr:NAD(P)/FAD-dependent oxidoreductase [Anaerococcus sp. mt242]MBM0046235.1 NAD(P)/FAD-dependent oxidoreductase [Anaerococcus sp. mt242]
MRYNLAVIGAGPAGLSAAVNASIRNKSVIVFGSDSPAISKTEGVKNYLGFGTISGAELNKNFKKTLEGHDIERSNEKVQQIYAMGDYFAIILKGDKMIEATSVIVATGIELKKDLIGEDRFFGKGVSYCATCDASFYKGKKVVLIGYNEESVEEANYTSEVVDKLIYVNMYKENPELNEDIEVINGEVPVEFIGEKNPTKLKFKSGKEIEADGFFIIRDSARPERLVPSIKTDNEHIIIDKNCRTNIRGLYAAGDVAGRPYQINKAAGEGQVAALDAAKYISLIESRKFSKDLW